ncbi:MAG: hypothetical protein R3279_09405 [Putridiphycobacter sp.]|nr:hypothetical protein [Putridiphycobacter sp.]
MFTTEEQIIAKLEALQKEVKKLITFFEQEYDYSVMVYAVWNAKDILGHLTFWHESFARNLTDVATDKIPNPLRGKLSEVNAESVNTTKNETIKNLIKRLKQAQKTIETFIFMEHVTQIPYKKGSRDYSRLEHLEVVAKHIHKHMKHLNKAYGTP